MSGSLSIDQSDSPEGVRSGISDYDDDGSGTRCGLLPSGGIPTVPRKARAHRGICGR